MRSYTEVICMLLIMNFRSKLYLYDIVTRRWAPLIFLRSLLIATANFLTIHAIKSLPLVFVSLVLSTLPLWTSLMSYLLLNERLTIMYIICLVLSFCGIGIMILGTIVNET